MAVYLHVTFTLDAHHVALYEQIYAEEFLPVLRSLGMEAVGIWKTLVGRAGEFTEIWRFEDIGDYERKWTALMSDPRVLAIFEKTGPLVNGETFKLMVAAPFGEPSV